MSLSKQLLILISLLFLIVFSASFVISMGSIRDYLEVESEIHMQDTATSLGLSLSPHMEDENDPILQTMMNAIFDMGYYREMRLEDIDGKTLVSLKNPVKMEGVPQWLINWLPMKSATASSEISSGWSISGTLYVSSNPAYAYLKLYKQAKETLLYSAIIFVGAFALLMLVLRFTLQPLKAIQKQANEISSGQFTTIDRLPWTREVRQVAQSMNSMSVKIGDTITRLNQRLDSLNDNLKRDTLTRLLNQATFTADVKRRLSSGHTGYVSYIKFLDLAAISKQKGNQLADTLLKDMARILNNAVAGNGHAYRLYGAEFAIIYDESDINLIQSFAKNLQQALTELAEHYEVEDLVHFGLVKFDRTSEFERLMPALIEAYEQARIIGHNAFFIKDDSISSLSEQEWKAVITHAINRDTPEIYFTAEAYNYDGPKPVKVMQEAFSFVKDKAGKTLSVGTFFSMAQEFGLAESVDRCIVNKVLLKMEQDHITCPVSINLTMDSIDSASFHKWLESRIEQSVISAELLTFSVSAYAATKNLKAFTNFSRFVKSLGAKSLIKRYSADIIAVDELRHLHLDYIRLARDLTQNIRGNASKPDFLEIMHEVSRLLDIKVLAEAVTADEDFNTVKQAGIYGISR
ncbi:MAG TPA: EAL domain-containing protein [Methylophaga aminisulfidivorans]|uniref:GGDEF and EAL domain protein n=1 Tax=Methylophaga aminisulfidivorans MP TaxID=1026882 RepID=F5SXI6_9GAMM|nr:MULTISPECIES: LapD/MoxY N-terminal periplasmic domain-containing protein [Methylophaga]EGL55151.1 GGDEF and EAL domain protein [Methylophaga aminisulfidivorans MP]WVI84175.1 LapD/MoxY N-terminal periplasmic domain-containing protein [Methylophaga thalassica]HIC47290.1 EAL domain-containing protein [Methylophaga sp.]HIM39613.1 EAL domain-containing protein [Methylophaga aminisulfidivorans]